MLSFLNQLTYGKGYADGGLVGGGDSRTASSGGSGGQTAGGSVIHLGIEIPVQVIQQGNAAGQQNQQSPRDQLRFTSETINTIKQYALQVIEHELGNGGMIDVKMRSP